VSVAISNDVDVMFSTQSFLVCPAGIVISAQINGIPISPYPTPNTFTVTVADVDVRFVLAYTFSCIISLP